MKQLLNPGDSVPVGAHIYIPPTWYRIYDAHDKHPKNRRSKCSWVIAGCVYSEDMYPIYKIIRKSEIILPAYILLTPQKDTILETDEFFSRNPDTDKDDDHPSFYISVRV